MKLQQVVGKSCVSQLIRNRLEKQHFHSASTAQRILQQAFPHHIVRENGDQLAVMVRDKSFAIAVFKQVM